MPAGWWVRLGISLRVACCCVNQHCTAVQIPIICPPATIQHCLPGLCAPVPLCPANFYSRSSVLSPDTSANHNTAAVFSFSPKQTYIRVAGSCTAVNLKFQIITNYQRAAQKQQKYVSQICWDTTLQVRPQLPQCPTICSSSDPNDAQKLLTIGKLEFAALEDVWWMFGCLV